MINVVYMGTPEYAKIILDALIKDSEINVNLVLTQPDRPVGRKKVLTPPPVKELAQEFNIDVLQPNRLRDSGIKEAIESKKPDFIIVAAFGQILPKEILDIAPCINLHASILPFYRGASPIQSAFLNDDLYSGVTAMLMDEGLDTGDILAFKYIKTKDAPLLPLMTQELSTLAADLTISVIKNFDAINPMPQLNAISSNCKKISRADGLVDFTNANALYKKYCAFFGWPGVFLESGLKLSDISLVSTSTSHLAGEVVEIKENSVVVGCTIGSLEIATIQPPSKAKMSAKAYITGKRVSVGDTLLW